ncbi:hypothetical protein ACFQY4_02425 [Catellatospora bangladeshensis]|uniref:hypothetical protein n=1 Tax=Catellatospora bangladeshensis TaxID=310355 RepID=UPI00360D28F6
MIRFETDFLRGGGAACAAASCQAGGAAGTLAEAQVHVLLRSRRGDPALLVRGGPALLLGGAPAHPGRPVGRDGGRRPRALSGRRLGGHTRRRAGVRAAR